MDFVTTVGDASSPPVLAFITSDEASSRVVTVRRLALGYGGLGGIETVGPGGILLERGAPFGSCAGAQWLELRTPQRVDPRWRYAFGAPCSTAPELSAAPRVAGTETTALRRATASADGAQFWAWVQRPDGRAELLLVRSADGTVLVRDTSWQATSDFDLRLSVLGDRGGQAGALLAVGGRKRSETTITSPPLVRFLDPSSLAVIDSVPRSVWTRSQQLWQILPCSDSPVVLLAGSEEVVAYDLSARQLVASVNRPALGSAEAVARCDVVAFASPPISFREPVSPGILWYFRDQLRVRDSIDLRAELRRSRADPGPHVFGVSLSPDGRYLWARVGFDGTRLSSVREPAEVVVIRLADKRVVSRFPLGAPSMGPMIRAP